MASSINLADVLIAIEKSGLKERSARLDDLIYLLDHNSGIVKQSVLNSNTYHRIFDVLSKVNLADQSLHYNAKTTTTKRTAGARLSEGARILRHAIKTGVTTIRSKPVKALIDHLTEAIYLPDDTLCEPLALEYARCLRTILAYLPHVEHLQRQVWRQLASFCVAQLRKVVIETADSLSDQASTSDSARGRSLAIRHSHDFSSGQLPMPFIDEILICLSLLTSATNAPVADAASDVLGAVIPVLSVNLTRTATVRTVFGIVNHVLKWIIIEDTRLVKQWISRLIQFIRKSWCIKSDGLRDELLKCLIGLTPFIHAALSVEDKVELLLECRALYEVIHTEYTKLAEKHQLRLEDVSLEALLYTQDSLSGHNASNGSLRLSESSSVQTWSVVRMLSKLAFLHDHNLASRHFDEGHEVGGADKRRSKRPRLMKSTSRLLLPDDEPELTISVVSLQILSLMPHAYCQTAAQLQHLLDILVRSCANNDSILASWSLIAAASLACQKVAGDSSIDWEPVWQVAVRCINKTSLCRASCHTINTLHQRGVTSRSLASALCEEMLNSPAEQPAILCESSSQLICLLTRVSGSGSLSTKHKFSQSMLRWLISKWTFPHHNDGKASTNYQLISVDHLVQLLATLISRPLHIHTPPIISSDSIQATVVQMVSGRKLLNYLLLVDDELAGHKSASLPAIDDTLVKTASAISDSSEDFLQQHIGEQLQGFEVAVDESFNQRPKAVGDIEFVFTIRTIFVLVIILFDLYSPDEGQVPDLQQRCRQLLGIIERFMISSACSIEKTNVFFGLAWQMMCDFTTGGELSVRRDSQSAKLIADCIVAVTKAKESLESTSQPEHDDSMLRMDDANTLDHELWSKSQQDFLPATLFEATLSPFATRVKVIESAIMLCTFVDQPSTDSVLELLHSYVERLFSLSDEAFILALNDLVSSKMTNQLGQYYVERLLDAISLRIFKSYQLNRSETALSVCVDFMSATCHIWTDSTLQSVHNLGLDIYEWLIDVALTAKVMSPVVQEKIASLLLQLCHIDPTYGSQTTDSSARTNLFYLLNAGPIQVQFYLSSRLPVVFGLFAESAHKKMFDDLQNSLPIEVTWLEGIAMRLLVLAELAVAWRSLLQQCIYYIFETAGRISSSSQHATKCMSTVSSALSMSSSTELFTILGPQMLYTWLENHHLHNIPYALFEYNSIKHFLSSNKTEIVAQLFLKGDSAGLEYVAEILGKSLEGLSREPAVFAATFAYCISWDTSHAVPDGQTAKHEDRLKDIIGRRDDFRHLIKDTYPAVLGHIFRSANVDHQDDKWLEKRESYADCAAALTEMRKFGEPTQQLLPSQQPHFKVKYLPDQLERLSRRLGKSTVEQIWTEASYTITAQMLLDTLHDALDSQHYRAVLEKLRLLIALSGSIPSKEFSLESTVRAIVPFLGHNNCFHDAIGILRRVLVIGFEYVSQNWSFMLGSATLMILHTLKLARTFGPDAVNQSQQESAVAQLEHFRSWLLDFMERICKILPANISDDSKSILTSLRKLSLPGNARIGTAESSLLLVLLTCVSLQSTLIDNEEAMTALRLLVIDFQVPSSSEYDCLGQDELALKYAASAWQISRECSIDSRFRIWAVGVIARAYSASGSLEVYKLHTPAERVRLQQSLGSEGLIVAKTETLLHTGQRRDLSIAVHCLRSMLENEQESKRSAAIQKSISLQSRFEEGTFGYRPPFSLDNLKVEASKSSLQELLQASNQADLGSWTADIADILCQASERTMLSGLRDLFNNLRRFAEYLLPSIIHIILRDRLDQDRSLVRNLVVAANEHFSANTTARKDHQKFLLKLLLYLKKQPFPGETSLLDRLRWVPCDYMVAAECAVRIGMPTTALQLVELASSPMPAQKVSNRSLVNGFYHPQISHELLLQIFTGVNEQDSYYGVEQPASLQAFMERSEYEGNGIQSLYLRSGHTNAQLAARHRLHDSDVLELLPSLSRNNFHALTMMLGQSLSRTSPATTSASFEAARSLQQWDVVLPDDGESRSSLLYRATSSLIAHQGVEDRLSSLDNLVKAHVQLDSGIVTPTSDWLAGLVALTDVREILTIGHAPALLEKFELSAPRYAWMRLASFESFKQIITNRSIVCAAIAESDSVLRMHDISHKSMLLHQAKALASVSQLARQHNEVEIAASAAFMLDSIVKTASESGCVIDSMVKRETAAVLWHAGEHTASIKILKAIIQNSGSGKEDVIIGLSGLLSQIGECLSEARLEKPADILQQYLHPAINKLEFKTGLEAGKAYFTFAKFCDSQLQSPAALEDFQRVTRLRQAKLNEVQQLRALIDSGRQLKDDREGQERSLKRASQWFKIDDEEYQRLKQGRDIYLQQSLSNYMLALQASNDHDACVLRLFALWLENHDSKFAQAAVDEEINNVPSWKFVLLMNQLLSRMKGDNSDFQKTLMKLIYRICHDHIYHTVHHVYASRKTGGRDEAVNLRKLTAEKLAKDLARSKEGGGLVTQLLRVDSLYKVLAEEPSDRKVGGKFSLRESAGASKMAKHIPQANVPPATVDIPLQPDARYENVPVITSFSPHITIMTGLSAPKVLTAICSNGDRYKQLFKGGNDDLRQDAIMEQVFGEVSKMLQNHKATRQRSLQVRTYKVIPLTNRSGIIEFVPNSIPLNDFLQPAQQKYFPGSLKPSDARSKISSVAEKTTEVRVKEFRRVCDQMPPVMRFFFFERFHDPDEWFEKRTAYTRTTATISMLGQVLGLGDRHCHNILLDEHSGEVVHIDLGVAFEAGRILPIPELVPFRLTRDIVDGMGVTGVEGIFKRCCEFTLDALREDKNGIMTLLNVLRYDPLYKWTLSQMQARRMQQQQTTEQQTGLNVNAGALEQAGSETSEAERALATVEKKLSKALSTSATVSELIQQARDDKNLATIFHGWAAFF